MKIKTEYKTFVIPINNGMHLIYENGYKNELIDCLNNYFGLKKKNKCVILDDDEEIIASKMKEMVINSHYNHENISKYVIEHFSPEIVATKLIQIYKSLDNKERR